MHHMALLWLMMGVCLPVADARYTGCSAAPPSCLTGNCEHLLKNRNWRHMTFTYDVTSWALPGQCYSDTVNCPKEWKKVFTWKVNRSPFARSARLAVCARLPKTVGMWEKEWCHNDQFSHTISKKISNTQGHSYAFSKTIRQSLSLGMEMSSPGKDIFGGASMSLNMEISTETSREWGRSISQTSERGESITVQCSPGPKDQRFGCLWQWKLILKTVGPKAAIWYSPHTQCSYNGAYHAPPCPPGFKHEGGKCKELQRHRLLQKFSEAQLEPRMETRAHVWLPVFLLVLSIGVAGVAVAGVWRYRRQSPATLAMQSPTPPFLADAE